MTLVLIFMIPWEDSISIATSTPDQPSSLPKLLGLAVAGLWFMTILMEGRIPKLHTYHALTLLFFLWSIATYLWTPTIEDTYARVKTYAQIFILILIVWDIFQKPNELKAGLQAYVIGAFVPIASSLDNYIRGDVAVNYEVRYSATGVNAVELAIFLLLALPAAWYLFKHPGNRFLKYINLAYIPLAIFTVFLTGSRTSLFAIIPAIIYIAWPKRLTTGRIIAMLLFLAISIFIFQAILPTGVIERLSSVFTSIGSADIGGRVGLWVETTAVFLKHPFFGSGSGSLSILIGAFSHQTFLSVLAETGLVGFVLFCISLVYIFMQLLRLPKGYIGLWLSTFLVWFIGILSVSFEFKKVTWLFFSFIILQGYTLRKQWQSPKTDSPFSEVEEISSPNGVLTSHVSHTFGGDSRDSV
jgi:O-antigen ligase